MCLEFRKLIEDTRIENPSWEKPEWIFVYQEKVSDHGMFSTPVEYCLIRVLSTDLFTLRIGDHIISLNSDELKFPSLVDLNIVGNRERPRGGQEFRFRVEGEITSRKKTSPKVAWAFVVRFLPPVWERSDGKIFYPARATLQFGRSNPSSWAVEDRDKLWNKLFDQILSHIPPAEEKQMPLPIPDVLPEPKIKIPEILYELRFNKTLEKQPRSFAKPFVPGMFGI